MHYAKIIRFHNNHGMPKQIEISGTYTEEIPMHWGTRPEDGHPGEPSSFEIEEITYDGIDITDAVYELGHIDLLSEQLREEAEQQFIDQGIDARP